MSGGALAAAGEQTFSIGYIQMKSDGLKKLSHDTERYINEYSWNVSQFVGSPGSVKSDGYSNPQGMFARYRYEFDDSWSIIGSISYALQDGATKASGSKQNADGTRNYFNAKGTVKGDYVTVLAGPAYRVNEFVSFYGLIGPAFKHAKQETQRHIVINDRVVSDGRDAKSENKTNLAYSVGAQFNVYKGFVVDAAYETSPASSDWKTNGFTVGVGYKF
jgi:attachment invasion locus protein